MLAQVRAPPVTPLTAEQATPLLPAWVPSPGRGGAARPDGHAREGSGPRARLDCPSQGGRAGTATACTFPPSSGDLGRLGGAGRWKPKPHTASPSGLAVTPFQLLTCPRWERERDGDKREAFKSETHDLKPVLPAFVLRQGGHRAVSVWTAIGARGDACDVARRDNRVLFESICQELSSSGF